MNLTSVLRYRSVRANVAILAAALVALSVLIGTYAEKLGAAFNDNRYYMAFGQRIYPPVTLTSAELGGLFAAIVVWIWLFIWVGLADTMLGVAEVSETTRNRFGEKVQPRIVRCMWITGLVLAVAFFCAFFDLYIH